MSDVENQDKKGFNFNNFSWMAFFFAPNYYAGYGQLQKGVIFAGVSGLVPFSALFVNTYAALKAKEELPIGKQDFIWKPAIGVAVFQAIIAFIIFLMINSIFFSLPSCNSSDTETLIEQIVGDSYKFRRLGDFVSVKDIKEQGFNDDKQVRSCAGTLVTTSGEYNAQYAIKWENKDRNNFYLELRIK